MDDHHFGSQTNIPKRTPLEHTHGKFNSIRWKLFKCHNWANQYGQPISSQYLKTWPYQDHYILSKFTGPKSKAFFTPFEDYISPKRQWPGHFAAIIGPAPSISWHGATKKCTNGLAQEKVKSLLCSLSSYKFPTSCQNALMSFLTRYAPCTLLRQKFENHVFLFIHLLDNIHLITTFCQTFVLNGLSRPGTPWLLPRCI
jgi:hypothetical protein